MATELKESQSNNVSSNAEINGNNVTWTQIRHVDHPDHDYHNNNGVRKYNSSDNYKQFLNSNKKRESQINESQKSYLKETGVAGGFGITGLGGAFAAYRWHGTLAVSAGIQMTYTSVMGGTVALAAAGIFGIGTAIVYGSKHLRESKIYQSKVNFNKLVTEYNNKIEKYNKNLQKFQEKHAQLLDYETTLNQSKLIANAETIKTELSSSSSSSSGGGTARNVIVLGPCGYGKSLLCNRLFGDSDKISKIRGVENKLYKVAADGETASETIKMQMVTGSVSINQDIKFNLYVTDTPDTVDRSSEVNINSTTNELIEFFNIIGGFNAFLLCFKLGEKLNYDHQQLLKKYYQIFGENLCEYCIIILTHCDINSKTNTDELEAKIERVMVGINDVLNKVSNNKFGQTTGIKNRFYTFGEKNYQESVLKLLKSLYHDYTKQYTFTNDKQKEMPINQLVTEMNKMRQDLTSIDQKEIYPVKREIERIKVQFDDHDETKRNDICNDIQMQTNNQKKVI